MRTLSTALLAAIVPTILTASHAKPSDPGTVTTLETADATQASPRPPEKHAIDPDLQCLALNIYHEARSEPESGQIAVARVTLNRVESDAFPGSICGVVKQGGQKRHRCQFSWWCDGKPDDPKEQRAWKRSLEISRRVLADEISDPTNGALYYHTDYVSPKWSRHFQRTTRIGRHLFYRPTQS
ncbi:cell wall hydrolase [Allochromatium palmeri]|uniref:Cell wall hydrolase n=1 Tax=Allochromatium palmeri TaxID=231048 RepID=A0A6N8EBJ4_9GAMM|nr:cell wall hydrolase [Allochromatium palmeri]MTW19907.1 cell wall hydrolase [Allochromatium palmeri]